MVVCGHGKVDNFCAKHGMIIAERCTGSVLDYNGVCKVIVTDREMPEAEYYYLKGRMLARGYELVSTKHKDTGVAASIVTFHARKENEVEKKAVGRCRFGYNRVNGELVPDEKMIKVVKRILELRDQGYSFGQIQKDESVYQKNGSPLSVSTIRYIIVNRKDYE